jgi:archaellum component FlaF (FlaF/FlaG flagellin family)
VLDAQREAQTRAVEETNTHLAVSSINTDNGTVAITNEGDITLSIGKIDLFIDGVLSTGRITSRTIMGSGPTDLWMPGEDLVLIISGDLTGASIKVVCENGASAHL